MQKKKAFLTIFNRGIVISILILTLHRYISDTHFKQMLTLNLVNLHGQILVHINEHKTFSMNSDRKHQHNFQAGKPESKREHQNKN